MTAATAALTAFLLPDPPLTDSLLPWEEEFRLEDDDEEDEAFWDALLSFLRCLLLLSLVALVVGEVEEDEDEAAADVTGGDEGELITWSESFEVAPETGNNVYFQI